MKIRLISLSSSKEVWHEEAVKLYIKKINGFLPFEYQSFKAKSLERKQSEYKKEAEGELILSKLSNRDFVILCDERGKIFSSLEFSKKIVSIFDQGNAEIVFIVGGAYGVSEAVIERANLIWSLSSMVMNHMLAQVVVLEQIYRASTIWKGVAYHNE